MKKSIFSALCLVLLATTTQSAWGETVTFSPSDYSGQGGASGTGGEASATKSGITITSTKAYVDGTTAVREYKNGTITISSTSTITSVVVTGTTTAYGTAFGSGGVSSGKWNAGTWTGSATSITFTAGAQARWKKITITYESGSTGTTLYLGLFLAAFVAVRACVRRVECLYATFHHIIMSKIDFRSVHFAKKCFVCFFSWFCVVFVDKMSVFVIFFGRTCANLHHFDGVHRNCIRHVVALPKRPAGATFAVFGRWRFGVMAWCCIVRLF